MTIKSFGFVLASPLALKPIILFGGSKNRKSEISPSITSAPNFNFLEQNYNLFDQESKAFFDVNKSYLINHENKVLHKDDNNNIAYVRYNSDEIDLTDYNIKKGIFGDLSDSVMEETIDKYFPSKESLGEKWNCIPTKYVYKCQE